ncbi:(serine-type) D-alanyl-D-alanine carboxypeptidase [Legionella sainthelensi]|uniref:hypothetical protein n=1 Tax=Legionella sainthelensi TaxID=28087 RepID=UPI000E205B8D|nr:hypothetical protein [Legionella sainthelensi]VEB35771.1 (serine-type) D-alanyl-D-alanine carboxypeptidase [Legionella sainthelensi]
MLIIMENTGSLIHREDVTRGHMSLAAEAGAIITLTEELVHWIRLLFSGRLVLSMQQQKLTELISM